MNDSGQVVSSMQGEGRPPEVVKWDGTTSGGELAPSGAYSCVLLLRGAADFRYVSPPVDFNLVRPPEPDKEGEGVGQGGY